MIALETRDPAGRPTAAAAARADRRRCPAAAPGRRGAAAMAPVGEALGECASKAGLPSAAGLRRRRAEPAWRRTGSGALRRGLGRLQAILETMPRPARRLAIERLSTGVRRSLLRHMEVVATGGPALGRAPRRKRSRPRGATAEAVPRPRALRSQGCVSRIRVGARTKFMARITIHGIAISSPCLECPEEAQRLRELLAQLRVTEASFGELAPMSVRLRWLAQMFSPDAGGWPPGGAAAEHRLPDGLAVLAKRSWSFRVLADVRSVAGRTVSSRRVARIGEAVAIRQRLQRARRQGWSSFRAAWATCMSQRRSGSTSAPLPRRPMETSSEPLRARLSALDRSLASFQQRMARREEARTRGLEKRIDRLQAQIERVAGNAAMESF